jgi:hypothetical protein
VRFGVILEAAQGRFTISAVSVAEVVYGFHRRGRSDRVAQFEAALSAVGSYRSTMPPRVLQAESTLISNGRPHHRHA